MTKEEIDLDIEAVHYKGLSIGDSSITATVNNWNVRLTAAIAELSALLAELTETDKEELRNE